MAKKKAKKKSMLGWAMLAVVVIGAALMVTGIFLDWTQVNVESVIGNSEGAKLTLQDYTEMIQKQQEVDDAIGSVVEADSVVDGKMASMVAFAYIAVIAMAATAVLYLLKSFLNIGLLRLLTLIGALATIVCTVIMAICTFVFASDYQGGLGELVKGAMVPAVGAWLAMVGGVVGGVGGLIGARSK